MGRDNNGFRCSVCGECCRGDQKVWLNPSDLRRLAEHLHLEDEEQLGQRRITVSEAGEHGIRRPRLRFVPTPAGPACRFLINELDEEGRLWGKCALHGTEAKPLVCRLAPLSRTVDLVDGSEEWREVPPVIGCPGWEDSPPPPAGRPIDVLRLDDALRADLDEETEYFRLLSGN